MPHPGTFPPFRRLGRLAAPAAALLLAGCQSLPPGGTDWTAAARTAETRIGRSLALVKLHQERGADERVTVQGFSFNTGATRAPEYVGLVLSTNGHVLVPDLLRPDLQDRLEVWVGDTSYPARPIKSDDTLAMTIIKLETDERFTPLDLSQVVDLARGEWAMALVPTGEDMDFQLLASVFQCRGEVGGRYRRFALYGLPRDARGALVLNRRGELAGLATANDALALADLRDDLADFLAAATGASSAEAEDKQKGWLGAYLDPINKDLAKARRLPEGGLWLIHADSEGPAYQAGLRAGDLVVALNGQPLKFTGSRAKEFFMKSLRPRPGTPFEIAVNRAGADLTFRGTIAKRPEPVTLRAEDLGVTVKAVTDSDIFTENLATREGVMVTGVSRGSAAATGSSMGRTLLMPEDLIVELAGQPTPDIAAFGRALEQIRRQQAPAVLVKYRRGQATGFAGLNLKIGEKGNGGRE